MSTEIISLKDYRKNLSQIRKKSQSENIQFIVMVHSEPAFRVVPIEKSKQKTDIDSYSLDKLSEKWWLEDKWIWVLNDEKITPMTDEEVWYVSDEEQAEIEELLKNPDCWEYWSSKVISFEV